MRTPVATCTPTGSLNPYVERAFRCADSDCHASLSQRWTTDGRDFSYVDSQGRASIDLAPASYRADPRGWWDDLAKRNVAEYSRLSAVYSLGAGETALGFWHHHNRVEAAPGQSLGPNPPECCGWPMRLVRDGWLCRERNTLVPFEANA